MDDPKDVVEKGMVEEEEGLIPAEERVLNVLVHQCCGDQKAPKRREKIVSEPGEKDLVNLGLLHKQAQKS